MSGSSIGVRLTGQRRPHPRCSAPSPCVRRLHVQSEAVGCHERPGVHIGSGQPGPAPWPDAHAATSAAPRTPTVGSQPASFPSLRAWRSRPRGHRDPTHHGRRPRPLRGRVRGVPGGRGGPPPPAGGPTRASPCGTRGRPRSPRDRGGWRSHCPAPRDRRAARRPVHRSGRRPGRRPPGPRPRGVGGVRREAGRVDRRGEVTEPADVVPAGGQERLGTAGPVVGPGPPAEYGGEVNGGRPRVPGLRSTQQKRPSGRSTMSVRIG